MRVVLLAAAVALSAWGSGCLDARSAGLEEFQYSFEDGPAPAPGSADTYWFVHVTGHESRLGSSSVACDRGSSFEVDVAKRELRFSPESHPYDPERVWAMAAFDTTAQGLCVLAYDLQANAQHPSVDLGVLGRATLAIDPSTGAAHVTVNGEYLEVRPGQVLRLSGEGTVVEDGERLDAATQIAVQNHGAWPRAGLRS